MGRIGVAATEEEVLGVQEALSRLPSRLAVLQL
jgi:hypothetical protein